MRNITPTSEMIEEYEAEGATIKRYEVHLTIENNETGQTWEMAAVVFGDYDNFSEAADEAGTVAFEMMVALDPEQASYMNMVYGGIDREERKLTATDRQPEQYPYMWTDDWGTFIFAEEWWVN